MLMLKERNFTRDLKTLYGTAPCYPRKSYYQNVTTRTIFPINYAYPQLYLKELHQ